ncbi:hypothetical protein G7Y89_g3522 [Cudoniella acicularis]|uniref:Uncharacterized protein n=1 Tax=Cudoniella acicularis TaxID=354080 RepID=A0A8H4W7J7_9HELO|nr:hypothetical protein G7Y89_g3522 [Cudoniella acicularis]
MKSKRRHYAAIHESRQVTGAADTLNRNRNRNLIFSLRKGPPPSVRVSNLQTPPSPPQPYKRAIGSIGSIDSMPIRCCPHSELPTREPESGQEKAKRKNKQTLLTRDNLATKTKHGCSLLRPIQLRAYSNRADERQEMTDSLWDVSPRQPLLPICAHFARSPESEAKAQGF